MCSMMRAIDPAIAEVLAANPVPADELTTDNLGEAREAHAQMMANLRVTRPASGRVVTKDYQVPGPPGAPDIRIRVHRPIGVEGALPCLFSVHGGGYVNGTYEDDDLRFEELCPDLGLMGASVQYRLAPETPYPGPLEDCYAGLRWVFVNADNLGADPECIGLYGASAGGGLAAGLALLARDRGEVAPVFQFLNYPMIDDREITVSSGWDVPIWPRTRNRFGWKCYLGDLYDTDRVPAYAAPARAQDLGGLPPTSIWVGTCDLFCDEDIDYAQRLVQAGVSCELHVYAGAPHGFDGVAPSTSLGRRCRQESLAWLAETIARRRSS